MTRRSAPSFLLLLGLVGCTATARVPDGIEFRSENWFLAAESGFVIAPTAAVQVVTDPAETAAFFSNHFTVDLVTALPGTPLIHPEQALYRLGVSGDDSVARLTAVRQSLARREQPDPEAVVALSRDLQQRFLLLSWLQEGVSEGIDDTAYDDYGTVQSGEDVRRFAYEKVYGRATAVVIDLWENEVLWRGAVDYATARLYGDDGGILKELERTRADAAVRLAEYFSQL